MITVSIGLADKRNATETHIPLAMLALSIFSSYPSYQLFIIQYI